MPVGDYVAVAELRARLGVDDPGEDTRLAQVVTAASREVDHHCGRRFYADTAATVRRFRALSPVALDLAGADISTLSGVVVEVDPSGSGSWSAMTEWVDQERWDGALRWPTTALLARRGVEWPVHDEEQRVRITARWGWASTPPAVAEAAAVVAAELWKLKDAPLGVAAFGEFGPVRVRDNPIAARLLAPYRCGSVIAAMA